MGSRHRSHRPRRTAPAVAAPSRDENNPDDWIYAMPTVEEVAAAGYVHAAGYHARVTVERADLVRRFREDATFRAEVIASVRAEDAQRAQAAVERAVEEPEE